MEKKRDFSNQDISEIVYKLHDINILVRRVFRSKKCLLYELKIACKRLIEECAKAQKQRELFDEPF